MKKFLAFLALFLCAASAARADDYTITLADHKFSPQELAVPAGQRVKITISNTDSTPAEFESYDLNREKVVTSKGSIVVFIGPLDPGTYKYFDDFHKDTTTGTIKAQ